MMLTFISFDIKNIANIVVPVKVLIEVTECFVYDILIKIQINILLTNSLNDSPNIFDFEMNK